MILIRGTTPTFEIPFPFDTEMLDEGFLTIKQNEEIIVEKDLSDCTLNGRSLTVTLSQSDTLDLSSDVLAEIQFRGRIGENAVASDICTVKVARILKDGEI